MNNFKKNSPMDSRFSLKNGLLLLLFSAFAGMANGQTALKYVPSTADVVVTVNLQNIDKKVHLAQLQQYDFYQAMLKEMYKTPELEGDTSMQDYVGKLFTDPASLGFDTSEPFYFFVEKVGFDTYLTFVQKIGDKGRYEAAVQALKKDDYDANLNEQEGMKTWQKGKELFAWNDEVVVNVMHQKGYDPNEYNTGLGDVEDYEEYDTLQSLDEIVYEDELLQDEAEELNSEEIGEPDQPNTEAEETETVPLPPFVDEELPFNFEEMNTFAAPDSAAFDWAVKVLNRDFLQPISRNERFALAKGKTDDVHLWMDYGFLTENSSPTGGWVAYPPMSVLPQNGFAQAMGGIMDLLYGDTYLSMGLNFEDGRMAVRSQVFFNEDMKQFYRRSLDTKFNKKFLRYVKGGEEMFGYFYLNYNIKNTIEETKALLYKMFAATPQYGQAASDAMKIIGIFIDEEAIGNLLRGDLMVSVSGMQTLQVATKTYEYDADFNYVEKDTVMMQTMPVFTALASYGNGKDIQKFIDLGVHSNVLVQEGKYFRLVVPGVEGQQFWLAKHDGMLIFTNNQYLMQQNLESGFGKKLRLPKNHKKRLCENAAVVYWNIPNTIRAVAGGQADSNIGLTGYMNSLGKEFYSMEMTSSKKVGDSVDSEMFLNLTGKDTNALEQFFNFVNDIYLEFIGGAKI